jgi:transposase InsO family protein
VRQKRDLVKTISIAGYPVSVACDIVGLSRSSYYYQAVEKDESKLENAIEEIAGQFPTYGTRRVAQQLRRAPYEMTVNRKRARRIMVAKKLLRPVKRRKRRTTDSQHPYPRYPNLVKELQIAYPEQVWVSDITYIVNTGIKSPLITELKSPFFIGRNVRCNILRFAQNACTLTIY